MRAIVIALAIAGTVTPVWADGFASSLRIDLSLYRAQSCLGENSPSAPLPYLQAPRITPCISDRFAVIKDPDTWEFRPTAWYKFSKSKQLGFGLDLSLGNKYTTLRFRGVKRILFQYSFY
jgi:hypothetical protein